ncbi:MAG TPA: hypothetical protein VK181_00310 [Rhizobium sp.]|nr:hypothetical protein [Rhizobium sp.]
MAYPFDHRRYRLPTATQKSTLTPAEWRCIECGKLLGVRHGARLHIRLQRHNYVVTLPAEAVCPACEAKNRT